MYKRITHDPGRRRKAIAAIAAVMLLLTGFAERQWTSRQETAHEIAELARSMGLPDTDPIIVRAKELWWEDEAEATEYETPMQTETPQPVEEISQETPEDNAAVPDLYAGVIPYEITYNVETDWLAVMLAKTVYNESRGIWSQAEQSMIIWTVINRVDAGMYSSVYDALMAPWQFAYTIYAPTIDDYGRDLTALASDVLYRWNLEKQGYTDVGRTLPAGYCWYSGNGQHNFFRASYSGGGAIYFGLKDPYC